MYVQSNEFSWKMYTSLRRKAFPFISIGVEMGGESKSIAKIHITR